MKIEQPFFQKPAVTLPRAYHQQCVLWGMCLVHTMFTLGRNQISICWLLYYNMHSGYSSNGSESLTDIMLDS